MASATGSFCKLDDLIIDQRLELDEYDFKYM